MNLLALDTSTEACSAALWLNGEVVQRYALTPSDHGRHILVMVEEVMAEAGISHGRLDGLGYGRGPGSFTGLRIAAGVAQGLALGWDLPAAGVSSLAALAQGAMRENEAAAVLAAIDARMNEVYWGAYRRGGDGTAAACGPEQLGAAGAITLPQDGEWWGAGSGWAAYGEVLQQRLQSRLTGVEGDRYPQARDVAALAVVEHRAGRAGPAESVAPVYLRDEVVQAPAPR